MTQYTHFNWNQLNENGRNCLSLASSDRNALSIQSWCLDLVHQNILNARDPPDWAKPHLRKKEFTSAHRRDRTADAVPGTNRQAHQLRQRLRQVQQVHGQMAASSSAAADDQRVQGVGNPAPAASSTPAESPALTWLAPVVVDPVTLPPPCRTGVVNPAAGVFCPELRDYL